MNAANEVDEDCPFVTRAEPQPFQGKFADQDGGWIFLPDLKRNDLDFGWIKTRYGRPDAFAAASFALPAATST